MKIAAIGLAAAMLAGMGLAAIARAAPPANLAPANISGWGWNTMDLEGQKGWYEAKLGMKVVRTDDREGKVYEYIMGFEGAGPQSAILALLASPQRKPGPSTAGRLILRVPDSKGLCDWLATQGVPARLVAPGAYFIADPEGNPIELYTPPAPAK
ncbi:VOC family protein [Phenylobacterium sp.]|uniref:VOC family protein n=1 Tax=Phenylobacterium sp. TaxID=1871053 RepID=UPI0025F200AC|nr:VOC family protein [Phenylobacterium sp.]